MISTGLFRQSGIEAWWNAVQDRPQNNKLPIIGAYQLCRHPIYASFIAMIWTTPHMTMNHLMITAIWSVYILYGAYKKDQRLKRNKFYQEYMSKIVAFPFLPKTIDNLLVRFL
jgi:protein-S-isoprenylcysteine O-methyltransferase Ste14